VGVGPRFGGGVLLGCVSGARVREPDWVDGGLVSEAVEATSAWAVRRIRAEMLQTLPDLPRALCKRAANPDLWHPDRVTKAQEAEAKTICHQCAEEVRCLAYALRVHRIPGIWGGTTEKERNTLFNSIVSRTVAE
jgi:WhiB family redox-sensing transcriptional regulator